VTIEVHVPTGIQARSPSLPVSKRSRRFPWRPVLFFPALCGALYFLTESNKTGPEGVPAASSVSAPLPAWVEIPIPEDVFRLETAEFAGGAYSARQHRTGGGRQDIFEFSGATEKESLLSLLIYQPGSEAVQTRRFSWNSRCAPPRVAVGSSAPGNRLRWLPNSAPSRWPVSAWLAMGPPSRIALASVSPTVNPACASAALRAAAKASAHPA
jgi:hypothetical protein